MDFASSREQETLRQSVREFCRLEVTKDLLDAMAQKGDAHAPTIWQGIAARGWTGLGIPAKYGGSGGDAIDLAIVNEELAYAGVPELGYDTTVVTVGQSILSFGSDEQKGRLLPAIAGGKMLCAFGLTEPGAGSDATAVETSVAAIDRGFVLNGTKMLISHAHLADLMLALARTERTTPRRLGLTALLVPMVTPGILVRRLPTIGGSWVGEVVFRDVLVGRDAVLGNVNEGWHTVSKSLSYERVCIPAVMVGTARRALDLAVEHARTRVQFGSPIGKFQALSHPLAVLATEVEAARLLSYNAAWRFARGLSFEVEASTAKLFASEVAKRVASFGMQVLGGYGYVGQHEMQRLYSYTAVFTVGSGSSQIQKALIARSQLGL